ncbi:unnamed protein product, partial [Sphacelaria rigidula]
FREGKVETGHVSRSTFATLMPFNVVKQTARCCLCSHCYKGKLIMRSLVRMWPRLHCGETAGSPCTCRCDLCASGGCR